MGEGTEGEVETNSSGGKRKRGRRPCFDSLAALAVGWCRVVEGVLLASAAAPSGEGVGLGLDQILAD